MRLPLPFAAVLAATTFLTGAGHSSAQQQPAAVQAAPFVHAEMEQVVRSLADLLERDFVVPEAGKAYATALRSKLAAGGYASFADSTAFAAVVTADLQAVHKDGHLRLFAPEISASGARKERAAPSPESTITGKGWLEPGVAYVAFSAFYGNDATVAELRDFLRQAKGARVLVVDARQHRGGTLREMNLLFGQIFKDPVPLLDMDTREAVFAREGDIFENDPTIERVEAPKSVIRQRHWARPDTGAGLTGTEVYLLTSGRSASAAEHMALALKRTGRAKLVGETTRGAGNYGSRQSLGFGYSAFIPIGRTFDPVTGKGWEGTGVAPDVAVPADQALAKALELAGVKVDAATALAKIGPPRTSAR